jgi:IMP dehydrogenase
MIKTAYTYDDIQLTPRYSEIQSRLHISLKTRLTINFNIMIPFIASPMDTICGYDMAVKLLSMGGVGCIHRFMSVEEQCKIVKDIQTFLYQNKEELYPIWGDEKKPILAAVGVGDGEKDRVHCLVSAGCNVILIDVAHGHHINVKNMIGWIKESYPHIDVIGGSVATYEATKDLIEWGADAIRVGIGGGSLCSTRIQTGFGIPSVTSIEDCVKAQIELEGYYGLIPIMADGGIRTSGDIAKTIAIGAECVMLGSLLAGTVEAPGPIIERGNQLYKRYRGSASLETKTTHGMEGRNVEGESTIVPFKGGVKFTIIKLQDGLRSALSYSGVDTIHDFQSVTDYVIVTNAGIVEAKPHLLL